MHQDVKNAKFQIFWETVFLWDLGYKKIQDSEEISFEDRLFTSVGFGKQHSSRVSVSALFRGPGFTSDSNLGDNLFILFPIYPSFGFQLSSFFGL